MNTPKLHTLHTAIVKHSSAGITALLSIVTIIMGITLWQFITPTILGLQLCIIGLGMILAGIHFLEKACAFFLGHGDMS